MPKQLISSVVSGFPSPVLAPSFSAKLKIPLIKVDFPTPVLPNNKILKWNYSFFPSRNKIRLERNLSCKKQRINDILNRKDPLIIEDWKKPRMVKILEKNSIIEEAIVSKPWKFFPYNNNS